VGVNVWLYRDAIKTMTAPEYYPYISEARDLGKAMRHLRSSQAPRLLLEVKEWNFLAVPIYMGRVDGVVIDRDINTNPVHHFDNRSLLLEPREKVLARMKSQGAGYIAAWTPEVRSHLDSCGLDRLTTVDTYTVYRVPAEATGLGQVPVDRTSIRR
jgi:hypothetical protein